jgi:hypothetical protein
LLKKSEQGDESLSGKNTKGLLTSSFVEQSNGSTSIRIVSFIPGGNMPSPSDPAPASAPLWITTNYIGPVGQGYQVLHVEASEVGQPVSIHQQERWAIE